MLNLRTDWTAEELMGLAQDVNTRIERVDGTLLMSHYSGYWVQFALVPDGCMADFGDAEFVLEIDAPVSKLPPLAPGVYRLVAVGRAPKMSHSQPFYDAWYDDSGQLQKIYRVNDYPMLHIGGSQDERIGWIRDRHGNQKPVSVTDDWRSYLIGTRGRVIECANAVVTLTPWASVDLEMAIADAGNEVVLEMHAWRETEDGPKQYKVINNKLLPEYRIVSGPQHDPEHPHNRLPKWRVYEVTRILDELYLVYYDEHKRIYAVTSPCVMGEPEVIRWWRLPKLITPCIPYRQYRHLALQFESEQENES